MTGNLWCIITSFTLVDLQPAAVVMNINKTSQQNFVLEGLKESTLYTYCLSAYDGTTDEVIGLSVCGMFKTEGI